MAGDERLTTSAFDIVILGGGPAGLAAAAGAARTGRSVLLLERAPVVGGMASSFDVAGVRVDHGSHRLHPSAHPDVLADVHRLLGTDLQVRARHGRIALDGRWVAFPLRAGNLCVNMRPRFALGTASGLLTAPLRRRTPPDSFAAVVRARFGTTMGEHFYFPYARKLWGLDATEVSAEQARRRISAGGAASLLKRVARSRAAPSRTFLYPRRGFGQIPERLADDAVQAGARIDTGVAANRLSISARTVDLSDGRSVSFSSLWSTIPATNLARLACAGEPVLRAAEALTFRSMVLVYV